MQKYMRLDRFVVEVLGETNDSQSIKKATRRIHNKLACGSIPRRLFRKFGKELYADLEEFSAYMQEQSK